MEHSSENCRSNCPINFVLETFGDKWTLLIVRDLMFKAKHTYGDFLASDEAISTNILADRLRRLENHGIVRKKTDPDHGAKLIYSLTQKGEDLLPVMLEITAWSAKHDRHTNTPREFLQQFDANKSALVTTMKSAMNSEE